VFFVQLKDSVSDRQRHVNILIRVSVEFSSSDFRNATVFILQQVDLHVATADDDNDDGTVLTTSLQCPGSTGLNLETVATLSLYLSKVK